MIYSFCICFDFPVNYSLIRYIDRYNGGLEGVLGCVKRTIKRERNHICRKYILYIDIDMVKDLCHFFIFLC